MVKVSPICLHGANILGVSEYYPEYSCTWLLMREFVKINEAARKEAEEAGLPFDDTQTPKMSYYKARQVCSDAALAFVHLA